MGTKHPTAGTAGNYLIIPFMYADGKVATLFIPKSFITQGDVNVRALEPSNLFGTDLQTILKAVEENEG